MSSPTIQVTPQVKAALNRWERMLLEWFVVGTVIVILFGLLVMPAVMSGPRSRISATQTEIRGLEGAIAAFKTIYGVEPPSRIRLYEGTEGSPSWESHTGTFKEPITGKTISHDAERVHSIAKLNRIWPNFDYKIARDLNGDGDYDDVFSLSGAECLVFFLGGRVVNNAGTFTLTGFSKDPSNPIAAPREGARREGPFFEFKPNQLRPSLNPNAEGFLVYVDSLPGQKAPFVYASSNEGHGYQSADLFVNSEDDLDEVYLKGMAEDSPPQKEKSFQIISPGRDGFYGSGGKCDRLMPNNGLSNRRDDDNMTNFSVGVLNSDPT